MTDIIQSVISSARMKKLSIFTGAAVSYEQPSYGPNWYDYKNAVTKSIRDFLLEDMYSGSGLLKEATAQILNFPLSPEIIFEGIDRFSGMSRVRKFIEPLKMGKPNTSHFAISNLVKKDFIKHVITTNWDPYIEHAIGNNSPLKIIHPNENLETINYNERYLVHTHGLINDSGIVQAGLYRLGFELDSHIKFFLIHIIKNTDCLIIGYSGNDWDVYSFFKKTLENSSSKLYWVYLNEHGLGENVKRLKQLFPKNVIPIDISLNDLLRQLCVAFFIEIDELPEISKPDSEKYLHEASEHLSHYSSYLTVAFACACLGKWDYAYQICEFATDAAYSSILNPDGPNHALAAEAYRFASACLACKGDYYEALSLLASAQTEYKYPDVQKSMAAGVKVNIVIEYQNGFIRLCKGDYDTAVKHFIKAKKTLISEQIVSKSSLHLIANSPFPMLETTLDSTYSMAEAIRDPNLSEALEINKWAIADQKKSRNIWGYLGALLSLSLCHYRMKSVNKSKQLLKECTLLSERIGTHVFYQAATNNLSIIDGNRKSLSKNKAPIVDMATGWNLVPDPFAFMLLL